MKKIFSVLVLIMFVLNLDLTAQAYERLGTLPKSEMALGGITLKRNYWDEITKIYGEPYLSRTEGNKIVYCYCSGGDVYGYADPFLFFLFDKNDKKMKQILLSGNTARMGETPVILEGGFRKLLE